MERYVPIEKRRKKEQKKFYAMQRNTWNGLNPVTRTVPNGKGYDRNKVKNEERRNGRRSTGYEPTAVFVCTDIFWMVKYNITFRKRYQWSGAGEQAAQIRI